MQVYCKYSQKIWWFGDLPLRSDKLKSANDSSSHLYTWQQSNAKSPKLKSAKILAIVVIWDQTAKLNYHQLYYGISY